jgi:hypothetical protein
MVAGAIDRSADEEQFGGSDPEPLTATTLAWLAVVPVAAIGVVLGAVLGPPAGRLLFAVNPHLYVFLPSLATNGPTPEPAQHARYLIALAVPAIFALGLWRVRASRWRLSPRLLTGLVLAAQLLGIGFAALSGFAQRHVWVRFGYPGRTYFPLWGLPAAVAFAALVGVVVERGSLPVWLARLPRRRWEIGCGVVAIVITVIWLLPDVYRDQNLIRANFNVQYNLMFSADDILSVADGRSPLVNYIGQYTSLLPYAVAPVLGLFSYTFGAFTGAMTLLTFAGFLCVHRVLRRVIGDPRIALVLYVPFVAVSVYPTFILGDQRLSLGADYAIFPLRYLGPFVLAWLCARHLDGAAPRRRFWLFALGGLVVVNNVEFGAPALGATFVALLLTGQPDRLLRHVAELGRDLVLGVLAAGAAVCVLTLLRAGALPNFGYVTYYARTYAIAGIGQLPMPELGFHLVLYMTFVGALLTAVVRARRDASGAALTGMLAFSAIFGLGASAYYANRSHPDVLTALFSAWGFSVSLLAWVAIRALSHDASGAAKLRARLRGTLPALATLVCLGLTFSTAAGFPAPWTQIARITSNAGTRALARPGATQFVEKHSRRGEHVLLLLGLGHDVARRAGVVNVMPFNHPDSIVLAQQLRLTVDQLRAEHGMRIFAVTSVPIPNPPTTTQDYDVLGPATVALIRNLGYVPVLTDPVSQLTEWLPRSDTTGG